MDTNSHKRIYHWDDFKIITCDDMFNAIFGKDPAKGTMSADFLKDTIYNEILQISLKETSFGEEKNNTEFKNKHDDNEYKYEEVIVDFKCDWTRIIENHLDILHIFWVHGKGNRTAKRI